MELNEYQNKAIATAVYAAGLTRAAAQQSDLRANPPIYCAIGLMEEVGEVMGLLKKALRDDDGRIMPARREKLLYELGDVAWYYAALLHNLDFTFEEVAQANLAKLADRKARNVLHGSGSDR